MVSNLQALKEKRKLSSRGVPTFQWRKFAVPGREDGLELEHWVKCYKDAAGNVKPADDEYYFAKFNIQVRMFLRGATATCVQTKQTKKTALTAFKPIAFSYALI